MTYQDLLDALNAALKEIPTRHALALGFVSGFIHANEDDIRELIDDEVQQ